jgi:FkbM family methyltransferase
VGRSNTEGLIRKRWGRARFRIKERRLRQRPPPPESRIREWSGILNPTENDERNFAPLVTQLESGTPHEPEFGFFSSLEGVDGLFIDVGANAGQSAVSLRSVNRSLRILSFEPNPLLEPLLRQLSNELLDGFDYRMIGLSDHRHSTVLYVPVIDGLLVTPLATLDRSVFERQHYHDQLVDLSLDGKYGIAEVSVELERFDDLDLDPAVVKIDTEEHELTCLAGMIETIGRCSPILMIEDNPQTNEIASFLATVGYEPFLYDADADQLVPLPARFEATNIFYVRPGHNR